MQIIDFEKKGNVVRFYLGADDNEDYSGDDWDNIPYEYNAEKVYKEHVVGYRDIAFPFEFAVLEPKDSKHQNYYRWCKNDMKARKAPCIIAVPKPDDYHYDEFNRYVGDEKTIKFYFGDKMESADSLTVFKAEEEAKEYLIALQTIKDDTKGFVPDWKDVLQGKYVGLYDHSHKKIDPISVSTFQGLGTIYFKNKEDIRESFKKHRKEWLIVLGVENENR